MKKIVFLVFILFSFSFLFAEENDNTVSENQNIEKTETIEENLTENSEEKLTFQYSEQKNKESFFKKKSTEYPVTIGLYTMWNNDLTFISFLTIFYPPVSIAVVNYDSQYNIGSVYEIAANNAFYTSEYVDFGIHVKLDLDIYYNSFGVGGGFAGGFYASINEAVMLKAGGRAAMYKSVPFAGPEASLVFINDSIKFDCTFCYGFTSENERLWRISFIIGFYVDG